MGDKRVVRKPALERAQAKAKSEQDMRHQVLNDSLGEGDTIEYSSTVSMKTRKGDVWLKFGSTTTVRPGETGDEARIRLVSFVLTVLEEQTQEVMS